MFFMKDASSLDINFGYSGAKGTYTNPGEQALLL